MAEVPVSGISSGRVRLRLSLLGSEPNLSLSKRAQMSFFVKSSSKKWRIRAAARMQRNSWQFEAFQTHKARALGLGFCMQCTHASTTRIPFHSWYHFINGASPIPLMKQRHECRQHRSGHNFRPTSIKEIPLLLLFKIGDNTGNTTNRYLEPHAPSSF